MQLAPYRTGPLCSQHLSSVAPSCPRCADELLERAPPAGSERAGFTRGVMVVSGLFAATVFGAVIGTAIGFVAGASPAYAGAMSPPLAALDVRPPPPPAWRGSPTDRLRGPGPHLGTPPPPARAGASVGAPVAAVTPLLAQLGTRSADPEVILARLEGLARSGVAMTIETHRLSATAREALKSGAGLARSLRIVPAERAGRVVGLEVHGVAANGLLREAGVKEGDVLLAVNGIELAADRWPDLQPFPGAARSVLVELEREGQQRVLVVRW